MVAGYQPGARLWSAAVQSTAQGLASPHLRLLLTVLGSAHAAATAAAAAAAAAAATATADADAATALSPTAATAAVSAPAPALDAPQTPPAAGDGGDELSRLLLHMLLEPAGAAGGGGGGGGGPLLFADGLAVACRFLPDAPLSSLLPRLLEQAVGRGSLQGLCLCGMGKGALPLLQAAASDYVSTKVSKARHPAACDCAACEM